MEVQKTDGKSKKRWRLYKWERKRERKRTRALETTRNDNKRGTGARGSRSNNFNDVLGMSTSRMISIAIDEM